jgi:hypothetical protein
MTDIVERLRRERETDHLCIAAAAEIEQLRADRAWLRAEIAIWREDNERLRAAGRDLLHAIGHDREDLTAEAAEKMRRALEPKS